MDTIKVLVIEPDPLRREGLVATLSSDLDMRVVGAGSDVVEALGDVSPPAVADVVLVDMDGVPRMRAWALLRAALPDASIVGLTEGRDERLLEGALAAAVAALLRPDAQARALCQAVRKAARGVLDYDPSLIERIKEVFMQPVEVKQIRIGGLAFDVPAGAVRHWGRPVRLTQREQQVLVLLGEGKSNRQIAQTLRVKESTVAFHVSNVLRKLQTSSRIEAGLVALLMQFLGPSALRRS